MSWTAGWTLGYPASAVDERSRCLQGPAARELASPLGRRGLVAPLAHRVRPDDEPRRVARRHRARRDDGGPLVLDPRLARGAVPKLWAHARLRGHGARRHRPCDRLPPARARPLRRVLAHRPRGARRRRDPPRAMEPRGARPREGDDRCSRLMDLPAGAGLLDQATVVPREQATARRLAGAGLLDQATVVPREQATARRLAGAGLLGQATVVPREQATARPLGQATGLLPGRDWRRRLALDTVRSCHQEGLLRRRRAARGEGRVHPNPWILWRSRRSRWDSWVSQ